MPRSININDVIKRLQDVMADGNKDLKKAIGGAVDLDTILKRTSHNPMAFSVTYAGSTIPEQYVNANEQITMTKNFEVAVTLNVEKFNGRHPQSLIPGIEEQLIHSLWCWDFDRETHGPMIYEGDDTLYFDRGRYIHLFRFSVDYYLRYTEFDCEIHGDDDVGFFDTLYSEWRAGFDEAGNETVQEQLIENIYNSGEPLN